MPRYEARTAQNKINPEILRDAKQLADGALQWAIAHQLELRHEIEDMADGKPRRFSIDSEDIQDVQARILRYLNLDPKLSQKEKKQYQQGVDLFQKWMNGYQVYVRTPEGRMNGIERWDVGTLRLEGATLNEIADIHDDMIRMRYNVDPVLTPEWVIGAAKGFGSALNIRQKTKDRALAVVRKWRELYETRPKIRPIDE